MSIYITILDLTEIPNKNIISQHPKWKKLKHDFLIFYGSKFTISNIKKRKEKR
jgi:hypothetical protein